MTAKAFITVGLILISLVSLGQKTVDVTDQTIKIKGEEYIYFAFAKGDKIIFNFREVDGKEVKEVEILEYPNNSKFSDFETSKIENKTFNVLKNSAYIFRFKVKGLKSRVCKIHIQRIPASDETRDFNTTVMWETKQDTTWHSYTKNVIVGYDTTYEERTKKELIKTEQKEELIIDKNQRVHSQTNVNGNKSVVFFTLSQNQTLPYNTKKVVSWAYWIGVGKEANEAWKNNVQTMGNLAKDAAAIYFTPLGALAVGAVANLMVPKTGEDVSYSICDQQNKDLFFAGYQYRGWDQGKGIAGFKKFTDEALTQGTYFICLTNDNYIQEIDVTVKVTAIVETKTYEDKSYTETIVKPIYETKLFTEPKIRTYRVPIIEE